MTRYFCKLVINTCTHCVSDCDVKQCRRFVGLNYCKLSVVFIFVLFMSFSLLMFSGEKYTLYVRDNQMWSLIRSYIFLYASIEVVMKICNCRKSHYLMIILLLSGDIERRPGPDSWTTIKHPNFGDYLRVSIYKIFLGEKLLPDPKYGKDDSLTIDMCDGFADLKNLFANIIRHTSLK